MFRRRLTLAMGSLAAASVLQGAAALWALNLADQHALHGRVTSDIHLEFVELSATKQRLRTWVSQALLGAGADPAERQRLQTELEDKLVQLQRLSQEALAFGAGLDAQARQVQLRRMDSLRVLDRSVERLRLATDQVRPLPSGANAQEAWAAISTVFEVSEGQNLRELIAQSTANAAASVVRERAAADREGGHGPGKNDPQGTSAPRTTCHRRYHSSRLSLTSLAWAQARRRSRLVVPTTACTRAGWRSNQASTIASRLHW